MVSDPYSGAWSLIEVIPSIVVIPILVTIMSNTQFKPSCIILYHVMAIVLLKGLQYDGGFPAMTLTCTYQTLILLLRLFLIISNK